MLTLDTKLGSGEQSLVKNSPWDNPHKMVIIERFCHKTKKLNFQSLSAVSVFLPFSR
jgi:hypothetical protein